MKTPTEETSSRGRAKAPEAETAVLPELHIEKIQFRIHGRTPLLCSRIPDDVGAVQAKAKNDKQALEKALYRNEAGQYAFPSDGLKKAAVSAASFVGGVSKVDIRGAFFIESEFIQIIGEPRLRRDNARTKTGQVIKADRAEYPKWHSDIAITYDATVLSPNKLAEILERAGYSIGIGVWRPEKNGRFGRFTLRG